MPLCVVGAVYDFGYLNMVSIDSLFGGRDVGVVRCDWVWMMEMEHSVYHTPAIHHGCVVCPVHRSCTCVGVGA